MARQRGLTEEERTLLFIERATVEQLARLIDRAQLVGRIRYGPDQTNEPLKAAKGRPKGSKNKAANGVEPAGVGFASTV